MSRKVYILRWRKAGLIFCSRKNSLCELVGDPRPWDPSPTHRKDITRGSWSHYKKRIQRQTHSTANRRPKGQSLSKQKYTLPVGPGVEFPALSTVVNKAGGDIPYLGVGISWKSGFLPFLPFLVRDSPLWHQHSSPSICQDHFACATLSAWCILSLLLLVENCCVFCIAQITYSFLPLCTSISPWYVPIIPSLQNPSVNCSE